ncbi:MAG: hypothetical protein JWO80_4345 [Bryobacterales bacterium]|nr:hypothetical protein [Bryobacterales bacterium]
MTHNFEFKNIEHKDTEVEMRKLIEEEVKRLDTRLKRLPREPDFLRVMVEEIPAHKRYHVSIWISVPGVILAAKEENREDWRSALKHAFLELERQLDEYRSGIRGEPEWKRRARREELRRLKTGAAPPPTS